MINKIHCISVCLFMASIKCSPNILKISFDKPETDELLSTDILSVG